MRPSSTAHEVTATTNIASSNPVPTTTPSAGSLKATTPPHPLHSAEDISSQDSMTASKSKSLPHLPSYSFGGTLPSLRHVVKQHQSQINIHSNYPHHAPFLSPHMTASLTSHLMHPAPLVRRQSTLQMTPEVLEQGSTQKRAKGEAVEAFLRRVTHVSIVGKGVEAMENLSWCRCLTVLYLYDNKITQISGLEGCKFLTRLYLQNNQIEEIKGLDCGLDRLSDLHLSGNKIRFITGLLVLPSLETLHVDNQKIVDPVEFDSDSLHALAPQLKVLTATGNRLFDVSQLNVLTELEELDLSHNDLSDWEVIMHTLSSQQMQHILAHYANLKKLNILNNPMVIHAPKIRQKAILASPTLTIFNDKEITQVERDFLYNMDSAKKRAHRRETQSAAARPQEPLGGTSSQLFGIKNLHPDGPKPIPHLPPYVTQYRDLMLHQMAMAAKPSDKRAALRSGMRRARVARAAEVSLMPTTPAVTEEWTPKEPEITADELAMMHLNQGNDNGKGTAYEEIPPTGEFEQYQNQMLEGQPQHMNNWDYVNPPIGGGYHGYVGTYNGY
ncbi:hypothetical protein HDU76_004291 [Blyttiomyces sp. JEL0837]|nr:hypothetical protein HDU76_004291 [Blyttiomyces sp. JEL0837]